MRPTLFRLASDTEDNDEALGEPQAELAFTSPAPPQYPHWEGATTRGPHSPALTLGLCILREKAERSAEVVDSVGQASLQTPHLLPAGCTGGKVVPISQLELREGGALPRSENKQWQPQGRAGLSPCRHCLPGKGCKPPRVNPTSLDNSRAGPCGFC